jgi:ferredoxin-fold anticodon binding domain-containing protein
MISELKIQIVSEDNESKEKLEDLNKKISDLSSTFNT